MMTPTEIDTIVDDISRMFETKGSASYGEDVTQLEHMVQSGYLAAEEGYDNEVVIAAFLHDIGHICVEHNGEASMGKFGARRHEHIGADYLRARGFSEKIAILIEAHVEAKRYLTHKYPEYLSKLSEASLATLKYQGGPMSETEAAAFEAGPHFDLCIKMREWDDAGKRSDLNLVDISPFIDRVRAYLDRAGVMQKVLWDDRASDRDQLAHLLGRKHNILLIADTTAYRLCGAKQRIDPLIEHAQVTRLPIAMKLPDAEALGRMIASVSLDQLDLIIAVGGGTTIDMAKLIRFYGGHTQLAWEDGPAGTP